MPPTGIRSPRRSACGETADSSRARADHGILVLLSYEWADHVGELELWVRAPDEASVYVDALHALGEVLSGDAAPAGEPESVEVVAEGDERATLFAAWLEELSFLAETKGFTPERVERMALEPGRLRARVSGRRGAPPHLVKAVTHHRLAFEPVEGGWEAVAVLDV
jgi:SHS2 domain-containing protein